MTDTPDIDPTDEVCDDDHCITCSDEALLGVLLSYQNPSVLPGALSRFGQVEIDGEVRQVDLSLVPGANVGDQLLIHAGGAIACLGPGGAE